MTRGYFYSLVPVFGLAVPACVADQVTKSWALYALEPGVPLGLTPFLSLRLGFNTGISFGLLAGNGNMMRLVLVAAVILIIAALTWMAMRGTRRESLGLSLIIGGASGNLIDRLWRGHVTDFIDIHVGGWHWPAFNVADSLITLGVAWLLAVNFAPALNSRA